MAEAKIVHATITEKIPLAEPAAEPTETTSKKKKSKKPPAPKFETRSREVTFFTHGDRVKFEIDPTDVFKNLGAGSWVGKGVIDQLEAGVIEAWAEAAHLPTTPFDRDRLRPVLMGILQNTIFRDLGNMDGKKEVSPKLEQAQANRVEGYKLWASKAAEVKEVAVAKAQRTAKERGHQSGFIKGPDKVYTPTKALPASAGMKPGQQQLIVAWFEGHRTGGTLEDVTKDLVAAGFTCNQPPDRAIYYYLNEYRKQGKLVVSERQASLPVEEPGPVAKAAKKGGK